MDGAAEAVAPAPAVAPPAMTAEACGVVCALVSAGFGGGDCRFALKLVCGGDSSMRTLICATDVSFGTVGTRGRVSGLASPATTEEELRRGGSGNCCCACPVDGCGLRLLGLRCAVDAMDLSLGLGEQGVELLLRSMGDELSERCWLSLMLFMSGDSGLMTWCTCWKG